MKALKTMTAAALAILTTSSAALASLPEDDWMADHLENKLNELVGNLQAAVGLDFLSREGFYVVAGIAVALALFIGVKVMKVAQHRDEMAKQERILRARRAAQDKLDREDATKAAQRQRRYGS